MHRCLGFFLIVLVGCGGGVGGSREVTEVRIDGEEVPIGAAVRADVYFETEAQFDGDPKDIEVVAEVSPALNYVPRSSHIYDGSTDDQALRDPDDVVRCPDGRTFLVFRLTTADMEGRELRSRGGYALGFEIRAGLVRDVGRVDANGADSVEFSCFSNFDSEQADSVKIVL